MPFPPWMEAILGLERARLDAATAISSYQSALASGILSRNATPTTIAIQQEALMSYMRMYYIAAPMIEQSARKEAKAGKNPLEGLVDPSASMPRLEDVPRLYRQLSSLIFKHKIITVKFLSRIAEEAEEMEEEDD